MVPPDPFIAHADLDLDEMMQMPPNDLWVGVKNDGFEFETWVGVGVSSLNIQCHFSRLTLNYLNVFQLQLEPEGKLQVFLDLVPGEG